MGDITNPYPGALPQANLDLPFRQNVSWIFIINHVFVVKQENKKSVFFVILRAFFVVIISAVSQPVPTLLHTATDRPQSLFRREWPVRLE